MARIQGVSTINQYAPNTVNKSDDSDGDNNLYKVKLVFNPDELGVKGKRPERIALTEKQVESKIFQNYGFNPRNKVQIYL